MFHLKIHLTGMVHEIFANFTVLVKARIMSTVSEVMVSRVSVSNNPNQTISSIFSAPHLIEILKMKHHANHLPRGNLLQVNTTFFKTVGFDMDSRYQLKYKLLVIAGVSVIRRIFREQVLKFLSSP